jgi:hypothetical protein
VPPRADAGERPGGGRKGAIIAAALVAVAGVGVIAVSQLGGADAPDDSGPTGGSTGSGLPVLVSDDFSDPASGWEALSAGGVTQGYVDGRYEVVFEEPAPPGSFALATGGGTGVSAEDVRITVDTEILGQGTGIRDGVGVSCRASGEGAYYFIISSGGGWSIQKLETGRANAVALATSDPDVPESAITRGLAANRIRVGCTGASGEPVTLVLSVNGKQVASVRDPEALPPGGIGLAIAGPTDADPAGFAVAFDDLVVEDLSSQ